MVRSNYIKANIFEDVQTAGLKCRVYESEKARDNGLAPLFPDPTCSVIGLDQIFQPHHT